MSKIGIISDTHGLLHETALAVQMFREHDVHTVIHCGDIGSSAVVQVFEGLETHFVLGNMDGDGESLRHAIEETGHHLHGWLGTLEIAGKRITFLHGHRSEEFERELASGNGDLLCYGHTHIASLQMYGMTMLLNPGAFKRVLRPSIAIVTLPELTVKRLDVG